MEPHKKSSFLPAERADEAEVRRQQGLIASLPNLMRVLDGIPDLVVFLNSQRQIVYLNRTAIEYIRRHHGSPTIGARWGEALLCQHASAEGGCGTTEFCRGCGVARATWAVQLGRDDARQAHLNQTPGEGFDFLVWTTQFKINGEAFTVLAASDLGDQERRNALEQIFFHDVLNTASGVRGIIEMLPEATSAERVTFIQALQGLSEELVEEIVAQRDLAAAETGDLILNFADVDGLVLIQSLSASYRDQHVGHGRALVLDPASVPVSLQTDRTLLRRVLGNMIKNALEATPRGQSVTLGCRQRDDLAEFWVHNPTAMPSEVRLQVYLRSFSTKGGGRGLGTYSMKLLSERYLGGRVDFTSSESTGTRFCATFPLKPLKPIR